MFAEPVRELSGLESTPRRWSDVALVPGENPLGDVRGELLRIVAAFDPGQAESVGLVVRGVSVRYDARKHQLVCKNVAAPLAPVDGLVTVEILVDRGSIEVFGNAGRVALSVGGVVPAQQRSIKTEVVGRGAKLKALTISELKSAWK
ncbi:MAG: GH32 C-terminal domain-containing protein [Planctomycetia bacterium]|nr:GH32 C-terminal domain-containing protein [Planctomycetia bacterium]